jgi:hypothetical protein
MCKIGFKYVQIKFIQRDKFQSLSTLFQKNQPIRIVLEIGVTSFHQSTVIPWPVSSSPPPPVYGGSLVGTSAILGHCRAPNIHAKMVGVYHLILPRLWRGHACDVSNTTKILPFLSQKKKFFQTCLNHLKTSPNIFAYFGQDFPTMAQRDRHTPALRPILAVPLCGYKTPTRWHRISPEVLVPAFCPALLGQANAVGERAGSSMSCCFKLFVVVF